MGERAHHGQRSARHHLELEYPCRLVRGGWSLGCRAQRCRRVPASVKDTFCLVVRLSGYFTLIFAVYTILGMVLGPVDMGFKPFMVLAAYGALGLGLMKMAQVVGDIAYGPEAPA